MTRTPAVALALAGCWSQTTPPPVTHEIAPPAAPVVARVPTDCNVDDAQGSKIEKLDGDATIALVICTRGERPYNGSVQDESQLTVSDWVAFLVRQGPHPFAVELGTWEQGWEWGGSWNLEGLMRPVGGPVFVVAGEHHGSSDEHSSVLHVYRLDPTKPHEVARFSKDELRFTGTADGMGTVVACNNDGPDGDCLDRPDLVETTVFAWKDGNFVSLTKKAP